MTEKVLQPYPSMSVAELDALARTVLSDAELDALAEIVMASLGKVEERDRSREPQRGSFV